MNERTSFAPGEAEGMLPALLPGINAFAAPSDAAVAPALHAAPTAVLRAVAGSDSVEEACRVEASAGEVEDEGSTV